MLRWSVCVEVVSVCGGDHCVFRWSVCVEVVSVCSGSLCVQSVRSCWCPDRMRRTSAVTCSS